MNSMHEKLRKLDTVFFHWYEFLSDVVNGLVSKYVMGKYNILLH